ncbi:hypothetical protein PTKIN_Ptkin15bG0124900 [Pterospermum kingtungense]
MASNSRVRIKQALQAMKEIGIAEDKVKPVLKKLLKLYDKNWELIESENYRVLADAIFDEEDTKVPEPKKKQKLDVCDSSKKKKKLDDEDTEDEGSVPDELVRPLKRLRKQGSCSQRNDSSNAAGTILKVPKVEENEHPPASFQQQPLPANVGTISPAPVSTPPASPRPVSPYHGGRNASPRPFSPQGPVSPRPFSPEGPVSPHHGGRNKGKQILDSRPLSPHVASNGKAPDRVSLALRIRDPDPEPGLLPTKGMRDTHALIIPKEEPFTDGIPEDEVPIAVIHPDSLGRKALPIGDFSTGKSNWQERSASLHADEMVGAGTSASMTEKHTKCDLATVPDNPSNLEIASSPLGEVKISLSYNSALGRPNFQFPTIDELREMMEQRCLRSYKLIDPNFDVFKILSDMCECISEFATDSSNQSQEGNVMAALDVLKKSPARDVLNAECNKQNGCLLPRMVNGSFNVQCSPDGCIDSVGGKELVIVPQHQLTPDELRWLHDASDITKGEEKVEISWVNEIDKDFPPAFQYISQSLVFQNARVSFSLSRIGDESCCPTCFGDCLLSQEPCPCSCQAGGNFAYTPAGVVKEDFLEECISMTRDFQKQCLLNCTNCPLERFKKDDFPESCKGHLKRNIIKECWSKCGCYKNCGNRVVQRGLKYKLQVFLTPDGKGWGLRTLEKLPKGAFVCEFVGEILTISELYARKRSCPILLDAFWGLKGVPEDDEALCLDATCYGNVARFINHRCLDANLIEIPVEVETPDLHYYHLAFFTTREVLALEELTWDYGIDFDDLDHPVKAFQCRCGSKFCRNMKRSTRSKSAITTR